MVAGLVPPEMISSSVVRLELYLMHWLEECVVRVGGDCTLHKANRLEA